MAILTVGIDTAKKAVVAIAAKNARMAWAVLTKGENFRLPA